MHEEEGRNEQSLFFDVLLPGRNRLKSVFWCGSAALLRRSALMEIGGLATVTVTEDYETSLHLRLKGYLGIYHNEHLIQGLAPDNLTSYVIQRFRWAQGNLQLFRPSMRSRESRTPGDCFITYRHFKNSFTQQTWLQLFSLEFSPLDMSEVGLSSSGELLQSQISWQ